MPFLRWNPSFSIGVEAFDVEHQELMRMINDLHQDLQAGKGQDAGQAIVTRLIDYTAVHFAHEEAELQRHGYPQRRLHREQHEKLKARVAEFHARLTHGQNSLIAIEMLRFLKTWLEKHIQSEDRHYGAFLNAKGIH